MSPEQEESLDSAIIMAQAGRELLRLQSLVAQQERQLETVRALLTEAKIELTGDSVYMWSRCFRLIDKALAAIEAEARNG